MVVVDGEHYPSVVEAALSELAEGGDDIAAAVLVGGREKLPAGGIDSYGGFPVLTGGDAEVVLNRAIEELRPDSVIDLSDEPVLDYRRRHRLAAVALYRGVPYRGADFLFSPPPRPRVCANPSVAIVGTGKRTGKTAICGFAARCLTDAGLHPVVVAMGRGGPPEPEVLRGDRVTLEPADLLALADAGRHAASDYIEDALLGRVPTVGCRRCGGGLAGGVQISNVVRGVQVANSLGGDLLLLEGSGSAIPPVHADVTGLVVPASIPPEHLDGYMGPYRLLLADFVVVTMCEYPFGTPSDVSSVISSIRDAWRPAPGGDEPGGVPPVVRTVFRPSPTRPVEGAAVYVATTASPAAGESIRSHLERKHGCQVVGITHSLSDRERLQADLSSEGKAGAEVLLCEIKAAGIDTATRWALGRGLEVVYMDNVPQGIEGDEVAPVIEAAARLATSRYRKENGVRA